MVEGASYEDIVQHNYETQYKPQSYVGTLLTFLHRYDMHVFFVDKEFAGNYIYHCCYYYLREILKG